LHLFGKHVNEPVWRPRRLLPHTSVPARAAHWLFDQSSLTRRVTAACAGRFRVEVLAQGWQRPMLNEALRLGVQYDHLALVREVYLYCDATPWVFARTIIPRSTLTGAQRHLAWLGDKPLGAVLFADPSMRRDEVEVAGIRRGQLLFERAAAGAHSATAAIWGRRSVFYLGGKPLLVCEIFLPPLLETARG
jgi:chorismate--pyruvate lyase